MDNNEILKKLRIALELRDDDIIEILRLADFTISKSELTALFRKEDHPNYKNCGDQIMRNFLRGLIIYKRGPFPGQNVAADHLKTEPKKIVLRKSGDIQKLDKK